MRRKWLSKQKGMPPAQIENVLEEIRKYVESGNFKFSEHAIDRRVERYIAPRDVLYILTHGYHEEERTRFEKKFKTWKYAIRGKTPDKEDVTVIVALAEQLVIITVMGKW